MYEQNSAVFCNTSQKLQYQGAVKMTF